MNDAKDPADFLHGMGGAALGAWLRRLSDRIDREAGRVYGEAGVAFEQRWFGVLNQLALHGARSVGEIAAAIGVTHVAVSQVRGAIEKAGLIVSEPDPGDGRSRKLRLTPKGQQLYLQMAPLWEKLALAAVELDREAGGVAHALARLEKALDRRSLVDRVNRS
jgi:DNA-binding MarR family transcriptional regulator